MAYEWVHLEVRFIKRESPNAFLCIITKADDTELDNWEEWIPKSHIENEGKEYNDGDRNVTFCVTDWIAEKIGFFK